MKMMKYILTEMSAGGIEKLPLVLDELGYSGCYTILDHCITINSNMSVLSKAIKMAEDLAHNERGHHRCGCDDSGEWPVGIIFNYGQWLLSGTLS